jgi:exodeoxyribonuclease VII small subunit
MEFKDFEQSLKRLEQIVSKLEKGELALERALELFEEGVKISRMLKRESRSPECVEKS